MRDPGIDELFILRSRLVQEAIRDTWTPAERKARRTVPLADFAIPEVRVATGESTISGDD